MRRFLSLVIVLTTFVLPMLVSCIPGGYEGDNPARPPDQQVQTDETETTGTGGTDDTAETTE